MNPAEVVEREVNRHRVPMHFDFLGVSIRQPRESADCHSHAEIGPLDVRRADVRRFRVANDRLPFTADAVRRGVATVAAARVNLVEHPVVHVRADERLVHGLHVNRQLVSRQLNLAANAVADVAHDRVSVRRRSIADEPRDAKFGIRVDGCERPDIASFGIALKNRRTLFDCLAFGVAERPNLIDLNALARQPANRAVMELGTRSAQISEQFFNGHAGNAGNPRRGAKPVAFDQSLYNQRAAFAIQPVHTSQYACSG